MANLSDLFGGGGGTTTLTESLPTFGVWSNYQNGSYAQGTYGTNGGLIAGGYVYTGSEGWNNYSGVSRTDNSLGSGSDGNTSWFQATPLNQSEGHWRMAWPTNGIGYAGMIKNHGNFIPGNWPYYGTVIGPAGYRQKISLRNVSDTWEVHHRGAYKIDYFVMSNGVHFNSTGRPDGNSQGMNSYNSRINRLVMIQGDNSSNYRLHVWTNPNINLNTVEYAAGDLRQFMLEAFSGTNGASYFYNDFSWSTSNSSSYNESRFHFRVILGDNGRIGLVRMTPSNQTVSAWILPNPSGTSLASGPSQIITLGLTTSYGIEQGETYGMRSMMNWNNSVVACYSPYYYYGSGINMHYISTADPSQQSWFQESNTSWGYNVYPVGKSSFGVRYVGENGDTGAGLYSYIQNPSVELYTGRTLNGSTWSNGGSTTNFGMYWPVDYGYTSTNYPHIVSMSSWSYTGTGA